MVVKQGELTKVDLLNRLVSLSIQIDDNNDGKTAEKVHELIRKTNDEEFIIGFCGHFSAGKSSMINSLMQEELLPSSPIPTSANLVKVKSGEEYARVYYRRSDPIEYRGPYDYEEVKGYCKDGDSIESIEISHSNVQLPEGVAVMDTPGIDSTDERHIMATESALHLADVIFYVMDYNHVQSEMNFLFTKMLKDRNKQLYLIINQIDKHQESELAFTDFKQSITDSFSDWGVEPDGIFYTSLLDLDQSNNDLPQLKKLLEEKMKQKSSILFQSIYEEMKQLMKEHVQFLEEENDRKIHELKEDMTEASANDPESVNNQIRTIEAELNRLNELGECFEEEFQMEMSKILENAYVMPFETRELAREFLESQQPKFKVGLLFSKDKTERERQNRLQAFFTNLKEKIDSQMDWHLKQALVTLLKDYKIEDEGLVNEVYDVSVPFEADRLKQLVKAGAMVNGDYILTYTDDVVNDLKRMYRQAFLGKLAEIKQYIKRKTADQVTELEEKKEKWFKERTALVESAALHHQHAQMEATLLSLIETPTDNDLSDSTRQIVSDVMNKKTTFQVRKEPGRKRIREGAADSGIPEQAAPPSKTEQMDRVVDLDETARQLLEAATLLSQSKGTHRIAEDMKRKAVKLQNRTYTTALFGAFSAGKSSFANALIGEKLLPVSPNPTTATVNKILPPDQKNSHGSILVTLKGEADLLKDVRRSLDAFGETADSIPTALSKIGSILTNYDGTGKEKTHYSFLHAVKNGFESVKGKLGDTIQVDRDEYREYAVQEDKACFVEMIDIYYDCALTRQGMTLVDTPGADSINARHTGVAFDYIKNADVILFVTYYNHAFSKADREFLIQLGRVKDSFEMDKMFFILNAADLAKNEEELVSVKEYVEDQLIQYGIRKPRMYPLSSKLALEEKLSKDFEGKSGIQQLENDYHHFIHQELGSVAVDSAHLLLEKAEKTLRELLQNATANQEDKEQKRNRLAQEREQLTDDIQSLSLERFVKSLDQEVEELVYYVQQRIFLRYQDAFVESFNPAILRDDRKDIKQALENALKELLQFIGFDLAQEMRATSLRIEKHLNSISKEVFHSIEARVEQSSYHPVVTPVDFEKPGTPEFPDAFEHIDVKQFKSVLGLYKNAKSFFEKNEKVTMRERLKEQLQAPVKDYLNEQKQKMRDHYEKVMFDHTDEMKAASVEQLLDYFTGIQEALSVDVKPEQLQRTIQQLSDIIHDSQG